MAHWMGDGEKLLDRAIQEQDLTRKVALMEDALILHFRETRQVLSNLGIENFSALGLREIREGK